ncbi:MAG TPA: hypothetical protein VFG04_14405 [Planctomycetaceae bacterium]|jgi:hypothetical protein|nr:hypothetical protein [Planctomycetaceae bacterium]
MKALKFANASWLGLGVAALLTVVSSSGCISGPWAAFQTNVGGQTLPSAWFLRDDVQYFPAGPQDKLFNERRALEQYKAGQLEESGSAVSSPAPAQPGAPGGPGAPAPAAGQP